MGVVSIVSANPLLALVMISCIAYAIATGTDLNAKAATIVKSLIISGAWGFFIAGAAVAIAVLYTRFAMDYTLNLDSRYSKKANTWIVYSNKIICFNVRGFETT